MKKSIEGQYYIKFSNEDDLNKKKEKLDLLFENYKGNKMVGVQYFVGEHSIHGRAIGFNIICFANTANLVKELMKETKSIFEKEVGKLNLIIEVHKDLDKGLIK